MAGIRENSPAENAIFTLQISFEIEQWNLRNRLRTLHATDGLFQALGVPRQFAACDCNWVVIFQLVHRRITFKHNSF